MLGIQNSRFNSYLLVATLATMDIGNMHGSMNEHAKQTVRHLPGNGAIEMSISTVFSSSVEAILRQLLPAPGCAKIGPFISFEHFFPARDAQRPGTALAKNVTLEAVSLTYTFHPSFEWRGLRKVPSGKPHCIQWWIVVPGEVFDEHVVIPEHAAGSLPQIEIAGASVRVVLGEAYGKKSPVLAFDHGLVLECTLDTDHSFSVPSSLREAAIYVVKGRVSINQDVFEEGSLAITAPGWPVKLLALESSNLIVFGGNPPRISRGAPQWSW